MTEYKTKPEGKNIKNIENITGINFITATCVGSDPGIGGANFWVMNIIKAIKSGRTNKGSGADKSCNHKPKGACLNSTLSRSAKNKAIKKGNCGNIGKQPPSGLIPFLP